MDSHWPNSLVGVGVEGACVVHNSQQIDQPLPFFLSHNFPEVLKLLYMLDSMHPHSTPTQ